VDDEFDDDSETVKGMARLFCEVAEAYIQLVLAATPEVRPDSIVCVFVLLQKAHVCCRSDDHRWS
jgi:hypothetical protein